MIDISEDDSKYVAEDEEWPDAEDEPTRLERWVARHITPFRAFWIRTGMNILLILVFIWAAGEVMEMKTQARQLEKIINETGCRLVYGENGQLRKAPAIIEKYQSGNFTNQSELYKQIR